MNTGCVNKVARSSVWHRNRWKEGSDVPGGALHRSARGGTEQVQSEHRVVLLNILHSSLQQCLRCSLCINDSAAVMVTGQLADTPTRGLPTRGLDKSRTGQVADATGDFACLVVVLLAASSETASCPVTAVITASVVDCVAVSVRVTVVFADTAHLYWNWVKSHCLYWPTTVAAPCLWN